MANKVFFTFVAFSVLVAYTMAFPGLDSDEDEDFDLMDILLSSRINELQDQPLPQLEARDALLEKRAKGRNGKKWHKYECKYPLIIRYLQFRR